MENLIKCEFFSHLFEGYQCNINIKEVESVDEILGMALSHLHSFLIENNLVSLIRHLEPLRFVIRYTLEEIKQDTKRKVLIFEEDNDSSSSDEVIKTGTIEKDKS